MGYAHSVKWLIPRTLSENPTPVSLIAILPDQPGYLMSPFPTDPFHPFQTGYWPLLCTGKRYYPFFATGYDGISGIPFAGKPASPTVQFQPVAKQFAI